MQNQWYTIGYIRNTAYSEHRMWVYHEGIERTVMRLTISSFICFPCVRNIQSKKDHYCCVRSADLIPTNLRHHGEPFLTTAYHNNDICFQQALSIRDLSTQSTIFHRLSQCTYGLNYGFQHLETMLVYSLLSLPTREPDFIDWYQMYVPISWSTQSPNYSGPSQQRYPPPLLGWYSTCSCLRWRSKRLCVMLSRCREMGNLALHQFFYVMVRWSDGGVLLAVVISHFVYLGSLYFM